MAASEGKGIYMSILPSRQAVSFTQLKVLLYLGAEVGRRIRVAW